MNEQAGVDRPGDSIGRNTASAVVAELLRAAFTAGLTIYLVRALSPDGYGLYALALGIGVLVLLPSDFGISAATSRFVAERRGDSTAVAAVLRDALRLKLVLAALLSAALAACAGAIASAYEEPGLAWPLRAVAAAVFAQSVFQLYAATFVGMARNGLQARLYVTEGLVETTIAVIAVLAGAGAAGALAGRAIGFAVAAALGVAFLARALGTRVLPHRSRGGDHTRRIAGYAGTLFLIDAAYTLFEQIDVLLLSAYLGSAAAGIFQAPLRLVSFIHLGGQAVSNSLSPRMAAHASEPRAVGALTIALRALTVFAAAATTVTVVWAEPLVGLAFGAEYDRSADVLQALGPFVFLGVMGVLVTVSVNYLGAARRRIPVTIILIVLQIFLDVLLIPPLGVVGPAVATDIAYAVYAAFHLWLLHEAVGLDLPRLARTLVRSLLAAAALAGVLVLAGTGADLPPLSWAAGAAGGLAAFLTVLAVTGEVRPAEVRSAMATLRARRRT